MPITQSWKYTASLTTRCRPNASQMTLSSPQWLRTNAIAPGMNLLTAVSTPSHRIPAPVQKSRDDIPDMERKSNANEFSVSELYCRGVDQKLPHLGHAYSNGPPRTVSTEPGPSGRALHSACCVSMFPRMVSSILRKKDNLLACVLLLHCCLDLVFSEMSLWLLGESMVLYSMNADGRADNLRRVAGAPENGERNPGRCIEGLPRRAVEPSP